MNMKNNHKSKKQLQLVDIVKIATVLVGSVMTLKYFAYGGM